jgi:hypothetical protein
MLTLQLVQSRMWAQGKLLLTVTSRMRVTDMYRLDCRSIGRICRGGRYDIKRRQAG